eukprot:TRINITY_DN9097_c0_g1_i1.p1 TRINITY_DN9097_c0_g1~~TRINITY_DN9097_c0_g1_i1.p1  ORF type:complete len:470 (-),score=68.03 TRINITY_DN9097_c0_g1_i1:91-1428(-)
MASTLPPHHNYPSIPLPPPHNYPSALRYEVIAQCKQTRARASVVHLPHGPVETPVFMPVGTQGTIKALTLEQVESIGYQIILSNTYHLALRPTADLLDDLGGLHKFMNWKRNILTDSGGFQMVSLLELSQVTEEGVTFRSPIDGSPMLLTPEMSIQLQNKIGSDIMMALDDVVSSVSVDRERFVEATHRTLRWIDRCINAHQKPQTQNLFGIVQGGLDAELRALCLEGMLQRDAYLPGYAIGGVSGGEDKNAFWRVVEQCTARLPPQKPRYCMGVGYPLDLVVCTALGVDMYDCVYPARTARFGTALVPQGLLRLKNAEFAQDLAPIDSTCACPTCQQYSRAYLHSVVAQESVASSLITCHNLFYMKRLMNEARQAIIQQRFPQFVIDFLTTMFLREDSSSDNEGVVAGTVPQWVVDALAVAGIDVSHLNANKDANNSDDIKTSD